MTYENSGGTPSGYACASSSTIASYKAIGYTVYACASSYCNTWSFGRACPYTTCSTCALNHYWCTDTSTCAPFMGCSSSSVTVSSTSGCSVSSYTTCPSCINVGWWCSDTSTCVTSSSGCSSSAVAYGGYGSSCPASSYTTCATCAAQSSYLWCAGACASVHSSCPTGGVYSASSCAATANGTSTSSTSAAGASAVDDAAKLTAGGVAATVIIAAVLSAAVFTAIVACKPLAPASPEAAQHKSRASSGWSTIFAGFVLQTFALLAGFAAPAIPWMSGSSSYSSYFGSASYSYIITATTITYRSCVLGVCASATASMIGVAGIFVVGAIINYLALILFTFPALVISAVAAKRVHGVAAHGVMPMRTNSCCAASLPAVTALSWTGFVLQLAGAVWLWISYGILATLFGLPLGAGAQYLGVSIAFNFIACVLFSTASCCGVGPLPFVGRSPTNCCAVHVPAVQPAGAVLTMYVPADKSAVVSPYGAQPYAGQPVGAPYAGQPVGAPYVGQSVGAPFEGQPYAGQPAAASYPVANAVNV